MSKTNDRNTVTNISMDELLKMSKYEEGIIFPAPLDEDPEVWFQMNEIWEEAGILHAGDYYTHLFRIEYVGCACILFVFGPKPVIDLNKLAIWRLQSCEVWCAKWLSDFADMVKDERAKKRKKN